MKRYKQCCEENFGCDRLPSKETSKHLSYRYYQCEKQLEEVVNRVDFDFFDRALVDLDRARRARVRGALNATEHQQQVGETSVQPSSLVTALTQYERITLPEAAYGIVHLGESSSWKNTPFVRIQHRYGDYFSDFNKESGPSRHFVDENCGKGTAFGSRELTVKEQQALKKKEELRTSYEEKEIGKWKMRQPPVEDAYGHACAFFKLRGDKVPDGHWCKDRLLVCVRLLDSNSSPDGDRSPYEGFAGAALKGLPKEGQVPKYGGYLMDELRDQDPNPYKVFLAEHILCPVVMMKGLYDDRTVVEQQGGKKIPVAERYLMNAFV